MMAVMPVFCLSLHAGYRCRHSGTCCTAGWAIPAEAAVLAGVRERVRLDAVGAVELFVARPAGDHTVGRLLDGSCVFFEPNGGRLCAIHRQAGPEYLPSACRHFPRVVLRDPRGTFVTLSHFCPTAAAMLLQSGPFRIVEAPANVALDGRLEGLDATSVLPPLLAPGVLVDYEGLSSWERRGIAVLDRDDLDAESGLQIIAAATENVIRWLPGNQPLAEAVERAFDDALSGPFTHAARSDRPVRAFLVSHLFASWAAYQPGGLQTIVESLRTALTTLRRELGAGNDFIQAVGAADLFLRHRSGR